MKIVNSFFFLILGGILLIACNQNPSPNSSEPNQKDSVSLDSASCANEETITDPNGAKPMALMMRQMAKNADLMKTKLINGEALDSNQFPFIRFYLVEPTDPKVLVPQFYENSRLFQDAYKAIFMHPKDQQKYYNLAIGKCINCHEQYCSGPLKRIRKLIITPGS